MNTKERQESAQYIMATTYEGITLSITEYEVLYNAVYASLEYWDYQLVKEDK